MLGCAVLIGAADAPDPASESSTEPTTMPVVVPIATTSGTETIVIFRHGEKSQTSGTLTPQGFNRALALCTVLPKKFGKPDYLFAPDPNAKQKETNGLFNYVRPLATIEPLAIALDLPVYTPCGYRDIVELIDEVDRPQYANAMIFVCWEHGFGRAFATSLVKMFGGDSKSVPDWSTKDYDSLYVVKIARRTGHKPTVLFVHDHEGLNGQSTAMPAPAK